MQFLTQLAGELSSGTVDLPCFPNVVLRIRTALADPKTTPQQTVTIVGAEPRLAARLLQTANSAAFNPSGRPLTELRAAITRLGYQLVQSAAMAFAVKHMRDQESLRSIAAPLNALWKQSITVALISQTVARGTRITPDEAFLTGLLHGIGRLYIMVRAIGQFDEPAEGEQFRHLIADWHASIGKAVLENWGFAGEMCEAVAEQGDHDRPRAGGAELADVLIVSIALADALCMPAPVEFDFENIASFGHIGLSGGDCSKILEAAEQKLDSLHAALGC